MEGEHNGQGNLGRETLYFPSRPCVDPILVLHRSRPPVRSIAVPAPNRAEGNV